MYTWNAPEDLAALARNEAFLAGEKALLKLELEEGNYDAIVRESVRRRLARTIVHLGVMIDPTVGDDHKDEA